MEIFQFLSRALSNRRDLDDVGSCNRIPIVKLDTNTSQTPNNLAHSHFTFWLLQDQLCQTPKTALKKDPRSGLCRKPAEPLSVLTDSPVKLVIKNKQQLKIHILCLKLMLTV